MQEALLIFPGQMIVDCSVTGKGCGLLLLTITKTKFSQSSNRAAAGAQEAVALTGSVPTPGVPAPCTPECTGRR